MKVSDIKFDLESKRLSVEKPKARFDKQGDMSDDERVQKAMANFSKDFGTTAAAYLDACIHCGMCAEACHYYVATGDPQYTPVWKLEPFKQAYKREAGPLAPLYRITSYNVCYTKLLRFNPKPYFCSFVDSKRFIRRHKIMYNSCYVFVFV